VSVTPAVAPRAFMVPGPPAVKGSTVAFLDRRGRVVTKQDTKNGKAWAAAVAWSARQAGIVIIPKGVGVIVSVEYALAAPARPVRGCPCVRPDVDKLARALLDALTGVAYEDDGQVVALTVRKVYESDTVTRVWVDRV
jgi:Holliday junction resolvase RusA-like endonuclease